MTKLLHPDEAYTFSRYFELKIEAKDLAKEFGYSFERKWLKLPKYTGELDCNQKTQAQIEEVLPYVSLTNETARREILVSPIMSDLIHYTKAKVRIEYAMKVTEHLQGVLDYFIKSPRFLIIAFAKGDNIDFGMTQLIAELIALDHWLEDSPQTNLIGAVTTGKIWEFATLSRTSKHIEQGLENFHFLNNFETLMRILVQSLIGEN